MKSCLLMLVINTNEVGMSQKTYDLIKEATNIVRMCENFGIVVT